MLRTNSPPPPTDPLLHAFEPPRVFTESVVRMLRLSNTALDSVFYDTPRLIADLQAADLDVATSDEKRPTRIIDLGALGNPEGSLLLIDATTAPYVHRFHDVGAFLESPHEEVRTVDVVTVTGVGSSALGSAALAWDVSRVLCKRVLAIVPGYGVADVIQQGLGGWFAFGLHDYLGTKTVTQNVLASLAPRTAAVGRQLSATLDHPATLRDAPVFRHGSGSSDVLHSLIADRPARFSIVVGHSKGALVIGNALRDQPLDRVSDLDVVTLGCPIAQDVTVARYHQFLGRYDLLGQMNMWGHWPTAWTDTWHSTNVSLLAAMNVGELIEQALEATAKTTARLH